jgi:sigma-E factor negative regulatory protein RseC
MAESGQVVEIKEQLVVVRLERKEACASCKACVAGIEAKDMFIEAENLCDAKIGDWVNISLEQSSFLKAVFIVYTIPLIALLVGLGIGYLIFNNELGTVIVGFSLLAISFLTLKMNEKHFSKGKYRPIAQEIVDK